MAAALSAQVVTPLDKQLRRIDIGVSGEGIFNHSVTGNVTAPGPNTGIALSDSPSDTVGALVNIRYIAKPYVGVEFNYSYARFTQNYSYSPFGVQAQATEETFGYIVTPPHTIFGFKPFVSAGAGTTRFKPTPRGGQSLTQQYRATYYYTAGIQQEYLSSHFGLRAGFRQAFYLAPDFGQNYLTILKHTSTIEPTAGFYFRF